jgi:hypothetical protein
MEQGRAKVDGLISAMLDRLGERPKLSEEARCMGLIGAIVRDLHSLGYQPIDPRYQSTLEAVLGIFEEEKARGLVFKSLAECYPLDHPWTSISWKHFWK